MEDSWFKLIEKIDTKIPIYNFINKIESKGIPTFPLFVIILLLVISIVSYTLFIGFGPTSNLEVVVFDSSGNAVSDAVVSISFADESLQNTTNTEGKVIFSVPSDVTVQIEVAKNGFISESSSVDIVENSISKRINLSERTSSVSKTVSLLSESQEIITDVIPVSVSCSGTGNLGNFSFVGGTMDLTLPSGCGTVTINPISGYEIVNNSFSASDSSPKIVFRRVSSQKGNVNVFVQNNLGNPVPAGFRVSLVDSASNMQKAYGFTSQTGSVSFENVETASYYVIITPASNSGFAVLDSSKSQNGIRELTANNTISFTIQLSLSSEGNVSFNVKDELTNAFVSDVLVKLKQGSTVLYEDETDSEGNVVFSVPENEVFNAEFSHGNYIIKNLNNVSASSSITNVVLTPATSSNTQMLVVNVVDTLGNPVQGAQVSLRDLQNNSVGRVITSGTDGKVEFVNIPTGTFTAYVVKSGFQGKNSEPIVISARETSTVSVVLNIGFGALDVEVSSIDGSVISGAGVDLINFSTKEIISSKITGTDGRIVFDGIRADLLVYAKVSAPEYLNYFSAPISIDADSTFFKKIIMPEDWESFNVELIGLRKSGDLISPSPPNNVVSAGSYTAVSLLVVPNDSKNVLVHFRTGKEEQDSSINVEDDLVSFSKISSIAKSVSYGSSFTPPKGYNVDAVSNGNRFKWANVLFGNTEKGIYELESDVKVDSSSVGEPIYFWVRTQRTDNGVERFPIDNVLGSSENNSQKQALYARASVYAFTFGTSSLCEGYFCRSFSMKDLSSNNSVSILDSYSSKIGDSLEFNFSLMNYSPRSFDGSVLEVITSNGLVIKEFTIYDGAGNRYDGVDEINQNIVLFGANDYISGSVVLDADFSGASELRLRLVSASGEELANYLINVSVRDLKKFSLNILPKEFVPFIDNAILIQILDDESKSFVSNALVSLYLDDELIEQQTTKGNGEVGFELESPAPGDVLKIVISKDGYDSLEFSSVIDESVLRITPPSLDARLTLDGLSEIETMLIMENRTIVPLEVVEIKISDNLLEYANIEFINDIIGSSIDVNTDFNSSLLISLGYNASSLVSPFKESGEIMIITQEKNSKKKFMDVINFNLKIDFGDGIDESDCLILNPASVDLITSGESKTFSVSFDNKCKVDGKHIDLSSLQARILYSGSKNVGKILVSSQELGISPIELTESFVEVSEMLKKNFSGTLNFEFVPNASETSLSTSAVIELRSAHPTKNGVEDISGSIKTNVSVNDLSKCVVLKGIDNLIIERSPSNIGFGLMTGSSMFNSYSPYTTGGGYSPSNYYQNPSSTYSNSTYNNSTFSNYSGMGTYPYSNYYSPNYNRYSGSAYEPNWFYDQDSFVVQNSCKVPVEVNINNDSEIIVGSSKLVLKPNEEARVNLEAGYRLGRYNVDVEARAEKSEDSFVKINSFKVAIKLLGDIESECIKLSSETIKMNNFIAKPEAMKIYNYCYDSGVIINPTDNVISFRCSVPGLSTNNIVLTEEGATTQPYLRPDEMGVSGNACPLIEEVYVMDDYQKPSGDKIIQTIEFEVKPNIEYRKQVPLDIKGAPFEGISGLRIFLTQGYYRVKVRSTATVSYSNQYGQRSTAYFHPLLEDIWGAGEFIDAIDQHGSSDITNFQECINPTSLDLIKYWTERGSSSGYIPETAFINDSYTFYTPIGEEVIRTRPKSSSDTLYCGGLDSLDHINPMEYVDSASGVKVRIIKDGSNDLAIQVDRSNMIVSCAEINLKATAKLSRVLLRNTQDVMFDIKLRVAKEIDSSVPSAQFTGDTCSVSTASAAQINVNPSTGAVELVPEPVVEVTTLPITPEISDDKKEYCKIGEISFGRTGDKVYSEYGFDKLNYTWESTEINDNKSKICYDTYCDATQATIFLMNKIKKAHDAFRNNVEKGNYKLLSTAITQWQKSDSAFFEIPNTITSTGENKVYYSKKSFDDADYVNEEINNKILNILNKYLKSYEDPGSATSLGYYSLGNSELNRVLVKDETKKIKDGAFISFDTFVEELNNTTTNINIIQEIINGLKIKSIIPLYTYSSGNKVPIKLTEEELEFLGLEPLEFDIYLQSDVSTTITNSDFWEAYLQRVNSTTTSSENKIPIVEGSATTSGLYHVTIDYDATNTGQPIFKFELKSKTKNNPFNTLPLNLPMYTDEENDYFYANSEQKMKVNFIDEITADSDVYTMGKFMSLKNDGEKIEFINLIPVKLTYSANDADPAFTIKQGSEDLNLTLANQSVGEDKFSSIIYSPLSENLTITPIYTTTKFSYERLNYNEEKKTFEFDSKTASAEVAMTDAIQPKNLNLNAIFRGIKEEFVCVNETDDGLDFYWNYAKIMRLNEDVEAEEEEEPTSSTSSS